MPDQPPTGGRDDIQRPQPPHVRRWQTVLNEHWPTWPREIPDGAAVRVRVRVVWERDGEQYLAGNAIRWDADHVYVRLDDTDGRLDSQGVWVKPCDVYRPGTAVET